LKSSSYNLIPEDTFEKMVELLQAISHTTRLQILNVLMNGERSVGELVKVLGTKQSLTSLQLNIMKFGGVLKSRRNGNTVYHSLHNSKAKNIISSILPEIS
jgi:DNA-binding transcriptional ArsR family regulator